MKVLIYERNIDKNKCTEFIAFTVWGFSANGDHSYPPSSLVSPKKGAGAGVGVGMLRSRGMPLIQNAKFEVTNFQSLKCAKNRSFQLSKYSNFQKNEIPSFILGTGI